MIANSLRLLACLLGLPFATSILMPSLNAGIKVEVFLDKDNGHGNGIIFDTNIGDNSIEIPMEGVSEGAHIISFRTTDDNDLWSTTITRVIYVFSSQNVEGGEYFIDDDPGTGAGIPLSISGNSVSTFYVPTGNLSIGPHTLTTRLLKNGVWGESMSKSFVVMPSSLLFEWFFDADPGVGLATQEEASAGDNVFMIPTENIQPGAHLFSSRVRDSAGRWSATTTHPIYVTEKIDPIVRTEYFVDSDPGEGNGNHVTLSDNGESSFIVATAELSIGQHTLTLRGQDASGKWHELFSAPFSITEASGVNTVEWEMRFDAYVEGENVKLVTDNIESGSKVMIVNLQGIILHESKLTDTSSPLLIPIDKGNGYIVIAIMSPDGRRSVKTVKL